MALIVGLGLALGVAYVRSSDELHEASAKVLLSRGSPAAALTGVTNVTDRGDPERFVQTQAEIGRTEAIARAVLAAEGLEDRTAADLMASREVLVGGSADVLEFRVRDPDPDLAARLAGEFAAQFTAYQRKLDRAALEQARKEIRARLEALRRRDGAAAAASSVYKELLAQDRKLETAEPLDSGKALVLSAPTTAVQVRPRPKTDLAVAFATSLLLGVLAAFLLEGLDRRLDSAAAVAWRLRLPFLGHAPSLGAPRSIEHMRSVAGRAGRRAEAFQLLRANVEAALEADGIEGPGSVIAFTSPRRRDGKSATVANLALAFALAGRRVILLELDAPYHARPLDVARGPGVAELAEGTATVDEALVHVRTKGGELGVLPLGESLDPLAAVQAGDGLPRVLEQLRERADLVLVDAPPLLGAAGALHVAAHADGLILVVRLKGARDRVLARVASLLGGRGPAKLGFIGTSASSAGGEPADPLPPAGGAERAADAAERGRRSTRGSSERSRA